MIRAYRWFEYHGWPVIKDVAPALMFVGGLLTTAIVLAGRQA